MKNLQLLNVFLNVDQEVSRWLKIWYDCDDIILLGDINGLESENSLGLDQLNKKYLFFLGLFTKLKGEKSLLSSQSAQS